jgi:gliding motility-associated-like protein
MIKLLRYFLFTLCLISVAPQLLATHNRAGEIQYRWISGLTYEVKIITYTKTEALVDRPYLKIRWGDEAPNTPTSDLDSLQRILIDPTAGNDIQLNEYVGTHTYSGPGSFTLVVEDPRRNAGINNILASVDQIFCISSSIIINPISGNNNSVRLENMPIQDACINQPWNHNPGAYDPDGDELVFSLVPCMGENCEPLLGWELPSDWTNENTDSFVIDPETGEISWNVPLYSGEYNIAIQVDEFRNGVFVGRVIRDMQITVVNCSNQPPNILPLPDYCVGAGEFLEFFVSATDPNNNAITLSAVGGPISGVEHPAAFQPNSGRFTWTPQCEEIRNQPYSVLFKATDNGFIPLTDVETTTIRVVAPRVTNPLATAVGNAMNLSWDINSCIGVLTPFQQTQVRYKIYRRNNEYGFIPEDCELGVPAYTGYIYVGETVGANNTSFVDNTVNFGGVYCYMVVTCWPDGAESYASEEFCDTIRKDSPVITNVTVDFTDLFAGQNTICWSPPTELDTLVFPGPYQYRLLYSDDGSMPDEVVYTSNSSPFLIWGDTCFVHPSINTFNAQSNYIVEFYAQDELIVSSRDASSVFLQLIPGDNQMTLQMNFDVPWINTEFEIYRKAPGESDFSLIATSPANPFVDTGLTNNEEYCYKVKSIGSYFAEGVLDPLINWSQENCNQPYDQTPPCPPSLSMDDECENFLAELTWNNPNDDCADDVTAYNIYYAPTSADSLQKIATIDGEGNTTFVFPYQDFNFSIAGCYAVTALDSLNLWPDGNFYQNESALSNIICIDNCPVYFLPNVFSPNSDGKNDEFVPFPYRYVESVDFKVYNRYGQVVHTNTDPDLNWKGTADETGEILSDGAYYYVITVNTIRLSGIVPLSFSGNIQLIGDKKLTNN